MLRILVVSVTCAVMFVPTAWPQERVPQGQTVVTATASVRGRVTDRNGRPVRSAQVHLRSAERSDARVAVTDASGQYEIRDLTPGEWTLRASKSGYASQSSSQLSPTDQDRPLKLANGTRATADVVLSPAGVIAGRVLDDFGDPVVNAQVRAVRIRTVAGQQRMAAAGAPDQTDDTGAFRVYGLPPGTYYVGVMARSLGTLNDRILSAVPTVYYPGTADLEQAEAVTVAAGQEQPGVTIVVAPEVRGATVSGLVLKSDGQPAPEGVLHLLRSSGLAPSDPGIPAATRGDGRFQISNVPPGNYVLDASVCRGCTSAAMAEHGRIPVSVFTTDVADVVVTTTPARTLRVQVETESGVPLPKPFAIRLETPDSPMGPTSLLEMGNVREMALQGISGVHAIHVVNLPPGWMVRSMEIGGQEISNGPFDFARVPTSASLRVVLTNRVGTLNGIVTDRGQPKSGAVIVFPEDSAKWHYPSRYVAMGRADEKGHYEVSRLTAGIKYRAVAVTYLESDEFEDPAFLERMRSSGVAFELRESEAKTLELPLLER